MQPPRARPVAETRDVEIGAGSIRTLRVGLLLESPNVPAWVWTAIREISLADEMEIVVAALAAGERRRLGGGALPRLLGRLDALLGLGMAPEQDAFAMRDARPLLAGVPRRRLGRSRDAAGDTFAKDDVAALQALDIEVLLWFGAQELRGGILDAARAGVWAVHLGDDRTKRGGPPGFWEVHEGAPVAGAALQVLVDEPGESRTLARVSVATVPTSVARTRSDLGWAALPMVERMLRCLHREGAAAFRDRIERERGALSFYSNRLYGAPTAADLVVHVARRGARLARVVARTLRSRRQWILFLGTADDLVQAFWRLQPLVPPPDTFWADPHIVRVGDRYFVFVEEVKYASGKGHIAVIEVDAAGRPGAARTVLGEPHHLSYPFVFEHEGAHYMVPESSANGTIDLYRATSFPDDWQLVEHLMSGIDAVDTTLLRDGDRWWLFTSVTPHRGAGSGELHLFGSDRLIGGDWRLHPASPLSSDVRGSRPAGAILQRDGRRFRPGQDGSGVYGRAIRVYEILELSDTTYREELVTTIEPDWDPRITRTHTLAHVGRLTIVDALWQRSRWSFRPARPRGDSAAG
jgi:hypothetical protein